VLNLENVAMEDNFFELGGHSLLAAKIIVLIAERLSVRLPALAVFQHPNIRQMALHIEGLRDNDIGPLPLVQTEFDDILI
jgi:acyl carrier protein